MHNFIRILSVALLTVLLVSGVAAGGSGYPTLAAVLRRTEYPLTVVVARLAEQGRIDGFAGAAFVVTIDTQLAYSGDIDVVAFVLLHELGHAVLGHLEMQRPPIDRMRDAWDKELAADAFAVRAMLLNGFDPLRAAERFFPANSYSDFSHPNGPARLAQVRALVSLATPILTSTPPDPSVMAPPPPLQLLPRGVAVP